MTKPDKVSKFYNGEVEIGFWEGRHRYSRIINDEVQNEWLTSVTAATGIIDKSRVLIMWAVRLTENYLKGNIELLKKSTKDIEIIGIIENACVQHQKVKEEAADLGSKVHAWAEAYIKAKPADRKKMELPDDERVLNGVTAFLKWLKDYKVKFIESEKLVYSKKYDYVGLMDLKAEINGKLALVDFKTSKGVYNEYGYQTAAYMAADEEESGCKYEERWIIKFGKDDGDFAAYKLDNFELDFKAFVAALTLKKVEKELSKRELTPEYEQ